VAARFWQVVLLLEVAFSAFLALAVCRAFSLPARAMLGLVPLIFVLLPWVLMLFVLVLRGPSDARGSARLRHVLSMEPGHFGAAVLAMSAERWAHRVARPPPNEGRRPVLLIHGLLCNRALWGPLRRRLGRAGWGPVCAVNLEPLMADLDRHAERIQHELVALQDRCEGERVTIITHSMGGLVARAALRAAGSAAIRRIITVACPHHGTLFGPHLNVAPLRQMRPTSPWLQALNAAQEEHSRVPVTSIYSLDDILIVPAPSAALTGARCRELRRLGHFGLLRAHGSLDRILDALAVE
jgi:predicted alpha/beta hydrolase family esterase